VSEAPYSDGTSDELLSLIWSSLSDKQSIIWSPQWLDFYLT
jgi:hypothetical protein